MIRRAAHSVPRRRRRRISPRAWPLRYRRGPWAVALLLVIGALAVADRTGYLPLTRPSGGDYERYDGQTFTVVHVVDGDTFDVDLPDGRHDRTRIRLWGVDTPEIAHGDKPGMHFGPEATAFARRTLLHRPVRLELSPVRSRDRYGRLLAFVYLPDGGEMWNETLVRTGHAYADPRFDHPHKERFRRVEREAEAAGVGLWEKVRPDDYPAWRKARRRR